MLWELVHFYNIPEKQDALKRAVAMLQEIRIHAASLLQKIENSGGKARIPELDALTTLGSVWKHIGFMRFLDFFDAKPPLSKITEDEPDCKRMHTLDEWNLIY